MSWPRRRQPEGRARLRQGRMARVPDHPRGEDPATAHGVKDATSDPAQIANWWERNPGRMSAIARPPGPDVAGHRPQAGRLRVPRAARAAGGRAGRHRPRPDPHAERRRHMCISCLPRAAATVHPAAHIDHRGEGGYVVAPPSEVHRAADGQLRPYVVVHHQASMDRINWRRVGRTWTRSAKRQWAPPAHLREGGQPEPGPPGAAHGRAGRRRKRYLFWAANRALDHGQPERLADLARAAARAAGSDPRQSNGPSSPPGSSPARTLMPSVPQPRESGRARHTPGPSRPGPQARARREPEPQAASPQSGSRQRGRVAVLEVDRDGPRPERRRSRQRARGGAQGGAH